MSAEALLLSRSARCIGLLAHALANSNAESCLCIAQAARLVKHLLRLSLASILLSCSFSCLGGAVFVCRPSLRSDRGDGMSRTMPHYTRAVTKLN